MPAVLRLCLLNPPSEAGRVEQQADKLQTFGLAPLCGQGTLGSEALVWGQPSIIRVTSKEPLYSLQLS